jgi:hypothetical protein
VCGTSISAACPSNHQHTLRTDSPRVMLLLLLLLLQMLLQMLLPSCPLGGAWVPKGPALQQPSMHAHVYSTVQAVAIVCSLACSSDASRVPFQHACADPLSWTWPRIEHCTVSYLVLSRQHLLVGWLPTGIGYQAEEGMGPQVHPGATPSRLDDSLAAARVEEGSQEAPRQVCRAACAVMHCQ